MFLSNKPTRLGPASKARLNAHSHHPHKLESIDRNKKSPDGNPPLPGSSQSQPSEVLVFNTSHHGGNGGNRSTRAGHYNQTLPEVPNFEEIQKFMKDSWDERIARINDPSLNLKVLWIKSYAQEEKERLEAEQAAKDGLPSPSGSSSASASASSSAHQSQPPTPKQKNSPQHQHNHHNNHNNHHNHNHNSKK